MFENNLSLKAHLLFHYVKWKQSALWWAVHISYQDIVKSQSLFIVYVGKYLSKSLFLPVTAYPN